MKKKIILTVISCCLFSSIFLTEKQTEPEVDFYDVTFLRNSPAVQKVLEGKGFFEVDFPTADNLMINATMVDRSQQRDITATIISCPGFVPGNKEGMTTLYAMLEEQPYNFIFIDSRGHGKSDGELLTLNGIKQYGKHQYLDVVATAQFIARYNQEHNINPDIILHGLCAGAFHTIKAVAYLKKHDLQTYNCIKGIIFDSGWPAIVDIAETVVSAEAASRCKDYKVPFLESYAQYLIVQFYRLFFKDEHSTQESITNAINELDQPILFIHAENDLFTPIHHVYPLIATAKKPVTWFVKDSSHVANHLKHKEKYTQQMQQFIQASL
jgi:pimeloyl-ACP methyl ester carboxylesterase